MNQNLSDEQLDDVLIEEHHKISVCRKRLDNLNKIKFVFLGVVAIALLFKLQHWKLGNELLIIGCISLSAVYIIQPFLFLQKDIGEMIKYMGFSCLWIAVLFKIQHWFGYENLLMCAVMAIAVGYVYTIFIRKKQVQS